MENNENLNEGQEKVVDSQESKTPEFKFNFVEEEEKESIENKSIEEKKEEEKKEQSIEENKKIAAARREAEKKLQDYNKKIKETTGYENVDSILEAFNKEKQKNVIDEYISQGIPEDLANEIVKLRQETEMSKKEVEKLRVTQKLENLKTKEHYEILKNDIDLNLETCPDVDPEIIYNFVLSANISKVLDTEREKIRQQILADQAEGIKYPDLIKSSKQIINNDFDKTSSSIMGLLKVDPDKVRRRMK